MAWGPDPNTEDELEKLAAVRGYLQEHFPGASIRDSYDAGRMAQVFRIETDGVGGLRDAVVSTEFLEEYAPEKMRKALTGLRVAEHLHAAKGREVLVTSWGVEERNSGAVWSIPRARCPRTQYQSYSSIAGGARSMRAMTG
jgi:hypothetical protein